MEDFTHNKSDETDAMIIARLVTKLRCYLPERAEPAWARLRYLGARRVGLVADATAARQQVRDLLECAWPAALQASGEPFKSKSWLAAIRWSWTGSGQRRPGLIRRWGWTRFAAAVRRELPHHGATRWYSKIVRAVFDAAADPARAGPEWPTSAPALWSGPGSRWLTWPTPAPRPPWSRPAWSRCSTSCGLTKLVTSIPGLSAVGAAAILAETGDPTRFSSARALVKHAGLCPRDNASGTYQGKTGHQRPRPPSAPAGGLASGVGRAAEQSRARRPVRAPDRPGRQQAHQDPGPGRGGRQPAAPAARRDHHRHRLGPRHRQRPQAPIP